MKRYKRRSFTLIELLVVIAVIATLAGMLLPSLNKARETAKKISCVNKLKGLSSAMLMYIDDSKDYFPPLEPGNDVNGDPIYWPNLIMPGIGLSESTHDAYKKYMKKTQTGGMFICPTHRFDYETYRYNELYMSYGLNEYLSWRHFQRDVDSSLGKTQPVKITMLKQPSSTMMLGDSYYSTTDTSRGYQELNTNRMAARHPGSTDAQTGTINMSWTDGHVSSQRITPDWLSANWYDTCGRFKFK